MYLEDLPLWPDFRHNLLLTRLARTDHLDRPAMLVVPGGGYANVCRSTEGLPIAERFASLGFQVFILDYRTRPNYFPAPQQDILRAIKLIRHNAADWHVIPDNIAAIGFSAGGHLAASAGIFCDEVDAEAGDDADSASGRPDATVLCYPVITFVGPCHQSSGECLLGPDFQKRREEFSLELRVTPKTPPAFLWHTWTDRAVPYQNTQLYAEALRANGVPCEEHIYPAGAHGQQLGYGNEDLAHWPEQAKRFLQCACKFRFPRLLADRRAVVLTFDDACKNHLDSVAPILLKHGFGATFFITRFSDEWRFQNERTLLTPKDILALHRMGFEIGNHTWNHPSLTDMPQEQIAQEIEELNRFLMEANVPLPKSFAYPGGPYAGEAAAQELLRHSFVYARTTEQRPYDPDTDSPLRIPAFPVQGKDSAGFKAAVQRATPGHPVVIVFHGIPDNVHPWVSTPLQTFEEDMDYLEQNDFTVLPLKDINL